ncbi:MAG: DUF2029 domain-containing protein [Actinobacteria bacterium]|nr:DUF2029 domain-containing protein [Actinomycetota bacterium]
MIKVDQARQWWLSERTRHVRGMPGLITSYVVTRALLILIPLGLMFYPGGVLIGNDTHLYWTWSEVILSGHYPVADPMWQYPPLAGFVFVIGAHLASDPSLGFIILALFADLAIFGWLLARARKTISLLSPWAYVIGAAAVGPVFLTRFDIFPTLFAVAALLLLNRPVRAGFMLGVGALMKVWPGFLLVSFPRKKLPAALAGFLAIAISGSVLLASWGPGSGTFLAEQGERGLQIESVGGAPYVLANAFGYDMTTIFRYGSLEIDATGAGMVATIVALSGFIAMGVIGFARLRGRLEHVAGADVALAIVLISIASSRVFSPQYMVWVVGVAAVCLLDPKTRMRPIIWLCLPAAIFGQLIYPFFYGSMMEGGIWGVMFQLLRIGFLLAATIWATVRIFQPADESHPAEDLPDRLGGEIDSSVGVGSGK